METISDDWNRIWRAILKTPMNTRAIPFSRIPVITQNIFEMRLNQLGMPP